MPHPNSTFPFPGSLGAQTPWEPPEQDGWEASARTPPFAPRPMSRAGLPKTTERGGASPEFLSLLLDERHGFPAHQNRELCDWLPSVLTACRSWPCGAVLIWDEASGPHGDEVSLAPQGAASGPPVLRIGSRWTMASGLPDQEWVAVWEGEPWRHAARTGPPPEHGIRQSCGDLFDLLAAAVEQRSTVLYPARAAASAGVPPNRTPLTGMSLRRELADWLQTPAGRQCAGPRLQPPALEMFDETLAAELATFIREDLLPAAAMGAGVVTPAWPSVPTLQSLDSVLHTLRTGGWSDLLDHLVPTLLVRLPPLHRCHSRGLAVMHAGQWNEYGWPHQGHNKFRITRYCDGRLSWREGHGLETTYPPNPDSFLEAALGVPLGQLNAVLPGIREELAAIMASNRTLMDIRLALAQRRYPCDQEMLLRMCLVNGQLKLAGEQLLHPERPQRPVTAADMGRWFRHGSSAQGRTAAVIAAEGISVVDAYRLASPLRPTVAGHELMGLRERTSRLPQDGSMELLRESFPELFYACQTVQVLIKYLRISTATLKTIAPPDLRERARRFCAQAVEAERLEMPPG